MLVDITDNFYVFCEKAVNEMVIKDESEELVGLEDAKDHLKFKFEHLILREHILSFYELDNLHNLEAKLKFLESELTKHFTIKPAKVPKYGSNDADEEKRKTVVIQTGCD